MLAAITKMPCAAEAMSNFSQKKGDRKISKNQKEKRNTVFYGNYAEAMNSQKSRKIENLQ